MYETFMKKVLENTTKSIGGRYTLNAYEYLSDIDEFIHQLIQQKYVTKRNYEYVINKLDSKLSCISISQDIGVYCKVDKNVLYICPILSKEVRRLCIFTELTKLIIDIENTEKVVDRDFIDFIMASDKKVILNDINYQYFLLGWKAIEKGIVQEIAESCWYNSLNIKRPDMEVQKDIDTLGENCIFKSNFYEDINAIYQPIVEAFSLIFKETTVTPLMKLCKLALNEEFMEKVIAMFEKKVGLGVLHTVLSEAGIVYLKKENIKLGYGYNENSVSVAKRSFEKLQILMCYVQKFVQEK